MARQLLPLPLPLKLWNQIAKDLGLSPQQKRIVELILRHACDKQIALHLDIKPPTITSHLKYVFRKLNVADRNEVVLVVFRMSHGL